MFNIIQVCEHIGIRTEVLGFTTRAWKGGSSRELWFADGRPKFPGRLNETRHIVYKDFDETVLSSAGALGVMFREGLLKENIDGEALLWAHSRLKREKSRKRLLFIISDGAPVDDSSLSENPANFLEAHLQAVIKWINLQQDINLVGIGLSHDVSRYYDASHRVPSPDLVGVPILETIEGVLRTG
jgi:cobaltochelatase CobT